MSKAQHYKQHKHVKRSTKTDKTQQSNSYHFPSYHFSTTTLTFSYPNPTGCFKYSKGIPLCLLTAIVHKKNAMKATNAPQAIPSINPQTTVNGQELPLCSFFCSPPSSEYRIGSTGCECIPFGTLLTLNRHEYTLLICFEFPLDELIPTKTSSPFHIFDKSIGKEINGLYGLEAPVSVNLTSNRFALAT